MGGRSAVRTKMREARSRRRGRGAGAILTDSQRAGLEVGVRRDHKREEASRAGGKSGGDHVHGVCRNAAGRQQLVEPEGVVAGLTLGADRGGAGCARIFPIVSETSGRCWAKTQLAMLAGATFGSHPLNRKPAMLAGSFWAGGRRPETAFPNFRTLPPTAPTERLRKGPLSAARKRAWEVRMIT